MEKNGKPNGKKPYAPKLGTRPGQKPGEKRGPYGKPAGNRKGVFPVPRMGGPVKSPLTASLLPSPPMILTPPAA